MNKKYRKNSFEIWEYKTDSKGKNCGGDVRDGAMCTPRFVIKEGGNVGIGTTNPTHLFHVRAQDAVGLFESTGTQAYLRLSTKEGIGRRVEFTNRPGGRASIWVSEAGDAFNVLRNGNVGIGTTNPTYKLYVNGTAYATGAAGRLSDLRYKTNINDISLDALELVKELRPVTFEWKEPQDTGMEGIQLGFIAQEVQEVLPEAVLTQDNEEQTKGLKYNAFIPILTKAIQELKAQNEALKAENNSLRHEIEQIKEAIALD